MPVFNPVYSTISGLLGQANPQATPYDYMKALPGNEPPDINYTQKIGNLLAGMFGLNDPRGAIMNMAMPLMMVGPKAKGFSNLVQFSNMADKMKRAEISDLGAMKTYSGLSEGKLSDFISHPQLYEQYPELANMKTNTQFMGNTNGAFNAKGDMGRGSITLNPNAGENTLLHEIQHAVQNIEGFPRGNSPEGMLIQKNQLTDLWKPHFQRLQRKMAEAETAGRVDEAMDTYNNMAKIMSYIRKQGAVERDPYDAYRRVAGEIEARDTATRMNLTPEQRLSQMPYASQDIPLEDWLIVK